VGRLRQFLFASGQIQMAASARIRLSVALVGDLSERDVPEPPGSLLTRSLSHFHSRSVLAYTEPSGLTCPMSR
jgi:hypothetical protein